MRTRKRIPRKRGHGPDGYLAGAAGGLVGAMVAWTLSLVVAGAIANSLDPDGGSEQLVPYFVTMGAVTVLGGAFGCWTALAAFGEQRAQRTALLFLLVFPVLLVGLELGAGLIATGGNGAMALGAIAVAAVASGLTARAVGIRGRRARAGP